MGKRPSLIKAAINRLDSLMAIGESPDGANRPSREQGSSIPAGTTSGIHLRTRRAEYQRHVLAFLNWVRAQTRIRTLEQLAPHASALAARYLSEQLAAGANPATLQGIRAALRFFFSDENLAAMFTLPEGQHQQEGKR